MIKLFFLFYDSDPYIFSATAAFMPENPSMKDAFDLKKLLSAVGAYGKPAAATFVGLI